MFISITRALFRLRSSNWCFNYPMSLLNPQNLLLILKITGYYRGCWNSSINLTTRWLGGFWLLFVNHLMLKDVDSNPASVKLLNCREQMSV